MSLQKLNEAYNKYIEIPDNRLENGKKLFKEIVQCLNEIWGTSPIIPTPIVALRPCVTLSFPPLPDEEHIPLTEFIEEYRVLVDGKKKTMATTGAIAVALRQDEDLFKFCGKRIGSPTVKARWFIKPLHFIHFVSKCRTFPKLRTKCLQWIAENPQKSEE